MCEETVRGAIDPEAFRDWDFCTPTLAAKCATRVGHQHEITLVDGSVCATRSVLWEAFNAGEAVEAGVEG